MAYEPECKVRRLSPGTIENCNRYLRYLRQCPEDEWDIMQPEDVKPVPLKRFLLEKEERGCKMQDIHDLRKEDQ